MKLERSDLLDRMVYGQSYTVTGLAQALRRPVGLVRDTLCLLVEGGHVEMTSRSSRIMHFRRTGKAFCAAGDSAAGEALRQTAVAAFPVSRVAVA